jgi:hypothetical protein
VLRRIGLARFAALGVALAFAAHPLACETVCWTSERKNALSALFGFAALWAWLRADGKLWRVPATSGFLLLALWSKAGALGIFPLLVLAELFGGERGLAGAAPMRFRPSRAWLASFVRLLPLALITAYFVFLNVFAHSGMLIKPPGGNPFTAILTDFDILSRYLFNLFAPVNLSFVYFVDPIRSVTDPRVPLYGGALATTVAVTIWLAENRRRAVFGWLWFLGALGPNLNLVAFFHLMQDRYVYLSTPGFFLVVAEVCGGLYARPRPALRTVLRIAAASYLVLLAACAGFRSGVWGTTLEVFGDAVRKQPQAAAARYELGMAYEQAGQQARTRGDTTQFEYARNRSMEEFQTALDACPDVTRFPIYGVMAVQVGVHYDHLAGAAQANGKQQLADDCRVRAEHYWTLAAFPPEDVPDQPNARALGLGYLAKLRLAQGRFFEAYTLATKAKKARSEAPTCELFAHAARAFAAQKESEGRVAEAAELRALADLAMESVPH